jgi:hypothetical protein
MIMTSAASKVKERQKKNSIQTRLWIGAQYFGKSYPLE